MKSENNGEIFDRLKDVIEKLLKASQCKNHLEFPQIALDTDLIDDLGLDSVEMMDLTVALSEEFKLNPNSLQISNVKKVIDIVSYIQKNRK